MATTLLEVRGLHKSFGGVHAVNNVSFELHEGEILGLIGPNGSGKSTTVNLINGTYSPDAGQILFRGEEIGALSIAKRAKIGIGRTFQSPRPFTGLTVFDSVYTIAMQHTSFPEAREKAGEILDMMGLRDSEGMPCEKLPIEKRKWLDMARILANDPQIVMLDEVMAGLNPAEMEQSIELVERINRAGVTVLFIEHVMKAVTRLSHRIVVLNEGEKLCEGDPQEVMRDPKVIKAYLGGSHHA